jgi:hypothetical protein
MLEYVLYLSALSQWNRKEILCHSIGIKVKYVDTVDTVLYIKARPTGKLQRSWTIRASQLSIHLIYTMCVVTSFSHRAKISGVGVRKT